MTHSGATGTLCIALAIISGASPGFSQSKPTPEPQPQSIAAGLKIFVLEGGNAINSISLSRSVTPVVEVRDDMDFPIEGASVVFTLPEGGPGGTFVGNKSSFTTRSNAQGQAFAPFLMNGLPGKFEIKVAATAGNRKGETTLSQTNSLGAYIGPPVPKRAWYTKRRTWMIIGAAAGGGVAALLLTRGSSSAAPPTITITPGSPGVGGPR